MLNLQRRRASRADVDNPSTPEQANMRRIISKAIESREAFEKSLESISNSLITENDQGVEASIKTIFDIILDHTNTNHSKCLSLELLDTLTVLDSRCMNYLGQNRLRILENCLRQPNMSASLMRLLNHWDNHFSQLPHERLSPEAERLRQFVRKLLPAGSLNKPKARIDQEAKRQHFTQEQVNTLLDAANTSLALLLSSLDSQSGYNKSTVDDLVKKCKVQREQLQILATEAVEQQKMSDFDLVSNLLDRMEEAFKKAHQLENSQVASLENRHQSIPAAADTISSLNIFSLDPLPSQEKKPSRKSEAKRRSSKSSRKERVTPTSSQETSQTTSASGRDSIMQSAMVLASPVNQSWPRDDRIGLESDKFFDEWIDTFPQKNSEIDPPVSNWPAFETNGSSSPKGSDLKNTVYSSNHFDVPGESSNLVNKESSKFVPGEFRNFVPGDSSNLVNQESSSSRRDEKIFQTSSKVSKSDKAADKKAPEEANTSNSLLKELQGKVDELNHRLKSQEDKLTDQIKAQLSAQYNLQLSESSKVYESTIAELRKDANELRNSLLEKTNENSELMTTVTRLKANVQRLEFQLKEQEKASAQAKDMWMKETTRASTATDNIRDLEKTLLQKEMQLDKLSEKYKTLARECQNLKIILRPENEHDTSFETKFSTPLETQRRVYSTQQQRQPSDENSPRSTQSRRVHLDSQSEFISPPIQKHFSNFKSSDLITENVDHDIDLPIHERQLLQRFRDLLLSDDGVIYETPLVQIGIKASFEALSGTLFIYLGNRTCGHLQKISSTVFIDQQTERVLSMKYSLLPGSLLPRQQICQTIAVQCTDVFDAIPALNVEFLLPDNQPTIIQLPLPVVVFKFMRGCELSSTEFFRYWNHNDFLIREATALMRLDQERHTGSSLAIIRTIEMNNAFRMLPGVDEDPKHMVFASVFPSKSIDMTTPQSLVLLRWEPCRDYHKNTCRIVIRSDSNELSRATRDLMVMLLSEPTKSAFPLKSE